MSRRELLSAAALPLLPASAFEPFDRLIRSHMRSRSVEGAALAISRAGRLLYSRGYGWAVPSERRRAAAGTLFRIASISKPVTAAAILRLVEQGRLELDEPFLPWLHDPPDPADPRIRRVTLRQLLQHTGGWDRNVSFDPMFRSREFAAELGLPPPAGAAMIIRCMMKRPLDFEPGSRYAYSNFGYCLLGRVIEQAGGKPYEQFVRDELLLPAGITRMRLGSTRRAEADAGEAEYLTAEPPGPCVWNPETGDRSPAPYGGFYLEAMDAHGGWIASAPDLLRFAAALEGLGCRALLSRRSLRALAAPPAAPAGRTPAGEVEATYYGLGWQIRPRGQGANWWHAGSLPGTWGLLVRRWDGLSWAYLQNGRSSRDGLPDADLDPLLHQAAAETPGLVQSP